MLRKATHPMYLMQIEDLWSEIDSLQEKVGKSKKDDTIKYSDFIDHFKVLENWVQAIAMPNSPFVRMLELEDVFMNFELITPLGYSRGESVFKRATFKGASFKVKNDFEPIDDDEEV